MHAFPELLQSQGERVLSQLAEQTNELLPLNEQEIQMLAFSDFVLKQVLAHPRFLLEIRSRPPQADEWKSYASWLAQDLSSVSNEDHLMRVLRSFRHHMLVRCAWMQVLEISTQKKRFISSVYWRKPWLLQRETGCIKNIVSHGNTL